MITTRRLLAVALLLAAPLLAMAEERIFILRTMEDPRHPPDAAICAAAPFQPVNVKLGATVWTVRTRHHDGRMVDDDVQYAGTATGCGLLGTTVPYVAQPFLIHFDLRDGSYTAVGTCTITSNRVPVAGILLVTCALQLTAAPPGVVGGSATSASVFNLAGLPSFDTGSIWTLRIHDSR